MLTALYRTCEVVLGVIVGGVVHFAEDFVLIPFVTKIAASRLRPLANQPKPRQSPHASLRHRRLPNGEVNLRSVSDPPAMQGVAYGSFRIGTSGGLGCSQP